MVWYLRNPVATGEVESLLVSDPGFSRGSLSSETFSIASLYKTSVDNKLG